MWHVSGETPQPIREEMLRGVEFLVQMAELLLIYSVMHAWDKRIPFIIVELDPTQMNPALPIKYRVSVDTTKLRLDPATSGGD